MRFCFHSGTQRRFVPIKVDLLMLIKYIVRLHLSGSLRHVPTLPNDPWCDDCLSYSPGGSDWLSKYFYWKPIWLKLKDQSISGRPSSAVSSRCTNQHARLSKLPWYDSKWHLKKRREKKRRTTLHSISGLAGKLIPFIYLAKHCKQMKHAPAISRFFADVLWSF